SPLPGPPRNDHREPPREHRDSPREHREPPAGEPKKKAAKLGKFQDQPMVCKTLDLYGLNPKDAVEIVERKINRALLAGAQEIKILHFQNPGKMKKVLHTFLTSVEAVKHFETPADEPNVTYVFL